MKQGLSKDAAPDDRGLLRRVSGFIFLASGLTVVISLAMFAAGYATSTYGLVAFVICVPSAAIWADQELKARGAKRAIADAEKRRFLTRATVGQPGVDGSAWGANGSGAIASGGDGPSGGNT